MRFNHKYFLLLLFVILVHNSLLAQSKRELRAVWIATVGNIDWPSKSGLSSEQQKSEMIKHLDFLQKLKINTIIIQVRPAADAFYESSYEPWSRYLSGKQGEPPFPKYDPLEFIIQEAHKRNIDVHAWFNPYRALVNSKSNPNPPHHPTKKHPEWIIHFDGKSYFDPGNPQAREYIINVMLEAVKKYDIDALHIDDYFYPYPVKGLSFNDNATYAKYGEGLNIADWRRKNVNTFISQLHNNIKKIKPWVKFGVSPFGIWRNNSKDPEGSATNGSSCYDDLYSDVRLWMQNNWVDYMAPQLYWERGHRVADFNALLPWWTENKYKRHLYIGLGVYRMVNATSGVWSTPNEILSQIEASRQKGAEGIIFYSLSSFKKIGKALEESLQSPKYLGYTAIPHAMPWLGNFVKSAPNALLKYANGSVQIEWSHNAHSVHPLQYLVYRFEKNEPINLDRADKIRILTKSKEFGEYIGNSGSQYVYVVTALDRNWNESPPSEMLKIN